MKMEWLKKTGQVLAVIAGVILIGSQVATSRLTSMQEKLAETSAKLEQASRQSDDNNYRISETERAVVANKAELKLIREQGLNDRELLVRIDERLRQVQAALRLPVTER